MDLDLSKERSPSEVRNLLEVRVRKVSGNRPKEEKIQALVEIREIADAALKQQ